MNFVYVKLVHCSIILLLKASLCLFIWSYIVCYLVLICWTLVFLAFVAFIGSNSPLWLKFVSFLLLHSISERLQLELSSSGELKDLFSPIRLSRCSSDEIFLLQTAWVCFFSSNDSLRVIRSSLGFVAMWNKSSIQKLMRHWIDSTNQFISNHLEWIHTKCRFLCRNFTVSSITTIWPLFGINFLFSIICGCGASNMTVSLCPTFGHKWIVTLLDAILLAYFFWEFSFYSIQ